MNWCFSFMFLYLLNVCSYDVTEWQYGGVSIALHCRKGQLEACATSSLEDMREKEKEGKGVNEIKCARSDPQFSRVYVSNVTVGLAELETYTYGHSELMKS